MSPDAREDRTFLVFQMAKVASRSWIKLLSETFPAARIAHFHSISRTSITRAEEVVAASGPLQTIKHLTLPRLGRPPESIQGDIRDHRWVGPPVTIISGIREPVARAASLVGFLSNRLGYRPWPVTVRDGGSPQSLRALFFRALRVAQGEDAEGDSMLRLLAHAVADYRRWFREELEPAFGLDISEATYEPEQCALCLRRSNEILVYRVEDLLDPERSERLLDTASRVLGVRLSAVPQDDATHEQRYRQLYKAFVQELSLSRSDLDWFYDHETVARFYTPDEVEGFRARWSAAGR